MGSTSTQSGKSFDPSLIGTYKTICYINVRSNAGVENKVVITIPKGTLVHNSGFYKDIGHTRWLNVKFTYKGEEYTGFCSKTYLIKT